MPHPLAKPSAPAAPAGDIRTLACAMLADQAILAAARHLAFVIREYGNGARAVDELEQLMRVRRLPPPGVVPFREKCGRRAAGAA